MTRRVSDEPADPSLAFTLSATLSAGDPALAARAWRGAAPRSAPRRRALAEARATRGAPFEPFASPASRLTVPNPVGVASAVRNRRPNGPNGGARGAADAFEPSDEGPTDAERHPLAEPRSSRSARGFGGCERHTIAARYRERV